jgi:hypothetical protein
MKIQRPAVKKISGMAILIVQFPVLPFIEELAVTSTGEWPPEVPFPTRVHFEL